MDKVFTSIQTLLGKSSDTLYSYTNRPVNLTTTNISLVQKNYTASIKADGLRCFLYYDGKDIYTITNPFDVVKLQKSTSKKVCIMDCEYIKETKQYYIFDVLYYDNKDVRNDPYNIRLSYISKDILSKNILVKKIYNIDNTKNIFQESKNIWDKRKTLPFKEDGIVYTPIYEPYENRYIFKWKPGNEQTIDFLVRKIPYPKDTFRLYVSSNNDYIKKSLFQKKEFIDHFPFITENNKYYPSPFVHDSVLTLSGKEDFLVTDNMIVECYYDSSQKEGSRWRVLKNREDKTSGYQENFTKNIYEVSKGPNSWRTSMSVWNSIQNPIDEDILFGKKELGNNYYMKLHKKSLDRTDKNFQLYMFNNFIKTFLYEKYVKKGNTVLDLAGGRGGDLYKLQHSDYILHINVVNQVLEEAQRRYDGMRNKKPNIDFLQFDLLGNNVNKIQKIKNSKNISKFDVITCQFAFHYMCKSKKTIDFILDIISNNIKENGYFIMTGYNGKKIHTMFQEFYYKDFEYKNTRFAKIIPKYDTSKTFKNYGQSVSVWVEKIGLFQDEYLIHNEYLIKQMKKRNITLVENVSFEEKIEDYRDGSLSSEEIEYIQYHNYFVFQKK